MEKITNKQQIKTFNSNYPFNNYQDLTYEVRNEFELYLDRINNFDEDEQLDLIFTTDRFIVYSFIYKHDHSTFADGCDYITLIFDKQNQVYISLDKYEEQIYEFDFSNNTFNEERLTNYSNDILDMWFYEHFRDVYEHFRNEKLCLIEFIRNSYSEKEHGKDFVKYMFSMGYFFNQGFEQIKLGK